MAKFQLLLRTNKPNKDGRFPIILKTYLGNKSKVKTLPFKCKKEEWDEKNKRLKKKYPKYKQVNEALRRLEIKMQNAIDDIESQEIDYDLEDIAKAFENELQGNRVKTTTVSEFMLKRIEELEEEKGFGYAKAKKDTYTSLFKFASKDLKFKQLTPEFLDKYEHFLRKTYTEGGIAFRMRDIRTAYNRAIRHGYAKESDYPFKIYKISKLKSNDRKIAINEEDLRSFKSFDVKENPKQKNTYLMFLFSYYSGGMNFKDLASLKWTNVKDGRLTYKRDKTKSDFNLILVKEALEILKYFKEQPQSENEDYVFPIVNKPDLTKRQIYGRYKRCLKKFNSELKLIAKTVGIDKNLTSYVSRHSFATHLKFNGVSEDKISQLLGHSSLTVTKSYLESFGNDVLDEAMSKLN